MMYVSEEWIAMVGFVGCLIEEAKLTEKQIDRICEACDLFMGGDKKRADRRLLYWAKKIHLDSTERWWLFEWYCS